MNHNSHVHVFRAVIATGISSVVTQIITIREFLSQFHGNEYIIAMILFIWLVMGGIGSLGARFATKTTGNIKNLAWLSLILSILPLIQIILIRYLRNFFFIHGSSVGFYGILIYVLSLITPYTLILGFVLPYSLFLIRLSNREYSGREYSGSEIYMLDNIGDAAGGALFSFILIFFCSPFSAIIISSLPLFLISIYLLYQSESNTIKRTIILFLVIVSVLSFLLSIYYEKNTLTQNKGELKYYKESRYGRIQVHKDNEQVTLYENGTPIFSSHNNLLAEEIIHYPLAQLSKIKNILLISAEGGVMEEIEKYNRESVDYIEIDPEIVNSGIKFKLIKQIEGLNIIKRDAKIYLSSTEKKYDAIIINLPEPDTFQLNRFYTLEFFIKTKKNLSKQGLISFGLTGFANYLSDIQIKKISSLYNTASKVFKNIMILPGTKTFFVCSDSSLTHDIPALLKQKKINTEYISGYYRGDVNQFRIDYVKNLINKKIKLNYDFSPYMIRLMFDGWFLKFKTNPIYFLIIILILLIIYLFSINIESFILFSTGFCVMGTEILVIFVFQIFYGYVYYQLGLIVTLFLIGLLPGVILGERLKNKGRLVLLISDMVIIIIFFYFIFSIKIFEDELPKALLLTSGFLISLTCGFQFPVALHLRAKENIETTKIFASDLIGASLGTLAVSTLLIPYMGIFRTVFILIIIKCISVLCTFFSK